MTDAVGADRPVCTASPGPTERFAVADVAEHAGETAGRDDDHRAWTDGQTEHGPLSGSREALTDRGRAGN